MKNLSLLALLALLAVNCVSIKAPAMPPSSVQSLAKKPQNEREQIYKQNMIDYKGKGYRVNSVEYSAGELDGLFTAAYVSDKTRGFKSSADSWGTAQGVSGFFGFLGLYGNGAFTVMWLTAFKGESKYASYVAIGWGITAAWFGLYIPSTVMKHKKLEAASESYNDDLARALELQQKTTHNPIPLHERYAHHAIGWTFKL